jgi:hypothetical protein
VDDLDPARSRAQVRHSQPGPMELEHAARRIDPASQPRQRNGKARPQRDPGPTLGIVAGQGGEEAEGPLAGGGIGPGANASPVTNTDAYVLQREVVRGEGDEGAQEAVDAADLGAGEIGGVDDQDPGRVVHSMRRGRQAAATRPTTRYSR